MVKVFNYIFQDWEEQKIKEFMRKKKRKNINWKQLISKTRWDDIEEECLTITKREATVLINGTTWRSSVSKELRILCPGWYMFHKCLAFQILTGRMELKF
jgi:hypothetical protein